VFTETPEQTDFGKDGYLDFSKAAALPASASLSRSKAA